MNGAQLKAAMRGGTPVWGTMINFARNTRAASLYGQLGFDFAIVDTEHAPNGRSEVADAAAALLAAGVCPVTRVPHTEPHATIMALDAGFHGVLVPYCETAEEVRAVVTAAKLRPLKGLLHQRARDEGIFPSEAARQYLEKRNANVVVIIGIESVPAVENLERILDVEGVDALFIGPNDLSVSLGIPDDFGNPRFIEAVEHVVSTAQRRGIPAGPHCFDETQLTRWRGKGARFVMFSSDWRALGEGYRTALAQARGTAIGPMKRPG
jgi:2-keto-3-deoxy-L-rhamnonate aldolase RhmA